MIDDLDDMLAIEMNVCSDGGCLSLMMICILPVISIGNDCDASRIDVSFSDLWNETVNGIVVHGILSVIDVSNVKTLFCATAMVNVSMNVSVAFSWLFPSG